MRSVARKVSFAMILLFLGSYLSPSHLFAAFTYKKYTVRYDRGKDILCEPYQVRKNDWILKVFKKKGEIAYQDFQEFLKIFRRINPHIRNVNRIRPGQQILIPLQKIPLGSLPGQSSGTVTIPFVTLSHAEDSSTTLSTEYTLKRGDCISVLISRNFGMYGTAAYVRALEIFKQLNPQIEDINRVYAGQKVYLPTVGKNMKQHQALAEGNRASSSSFNTEPLLSAVSDESKHRSNLAHIAAALGATLLNKGEYYFPQISGPDLKLDLSKYPILVLSDKTRIMFSGKNRKKSPYSFVADSFWKNLKEIKLSPKAPFDQILDSVMAVMNLNPDHKTLGLSEGGVKIQIHGKWLFPGIESPEVTLRTLCIFLIEGVHEQTPETVVRYLEQNDIIIREILTKKGKIKDDLKNSDLYSVYEPRVVKVDALDNRMFVKDVMSALGCSYTQNVGITFPYAGIQVKAVSNLISTRDGTPVFVDFGDLYGDAVNAIEKTGFRVIQIRQNDNPSETLPMLFAAAGATFVKDPTIQAANRSGKRNTLFTIPGFLVDTAENHKTLLTHLQLPLELIYFLNQRDIKVVYIRSNEASITG